MDNDSILSVFVDESGNFGDPNDPARLCIVTFVFHNQENDISEAVRELDRANNDLGLDSEKFQFHTSPLIRQDDEYAAMSRRMRGRILDRMLTFVRRVDFAYTCFSVDTRFVNTPAQIADRLERQIAASDNTHQSLFSDIGCVKVYYDAGQKAVSRILESPRCLGHCRARSRSRRVRVKINTSFFKSQTSSAWCGSSSYDLMQGCRPTAPRPASSAALATSSEMFSRRSRPKRYSQQRSRLR